MEVVFAQKLVEDKLNNIKYIFKKRPFDQFITHLIFKMSSNEEIQANIQYHKEYCDILFFIHPIIITSQSFVPTLQIINIINNYVKSSGRFYIDQDFNVVYSMRSKYEVIDRMPDEFISEFAAAIAFFEDVFDILIDIGTGRQSVEFCADLIKRMWSE